MKKPQNSGKSPHPASAAGSPGVNASAKAFLHDQDPDLPDPAHVPSLPTISRLNCSPGRFTMAL